MTAAALVGGCALAGPAGPGPEPALTGRASDAPEPAVPPPTTAPDVRGAGTRLEVGDLRLAVDERVTALEVQAGSGADPDGSTTYRFTVAPDDPRAGPGPVPVARLATPEGGSFEVHPDRSVLVLDADGTPVAGLAPPTVDGADAGAWRPDLERVGGDLLVLRLEGSSAAAPAELEVTWWVTATALLGATWGEREGGRSIAVEPTAWARAGHDAAVALTWAQLVGAHPEAESASMHDQLVCHSIGAPDKATWNLEPWRPDVGLLGVLAAACNPT